MTDTTDTTDFPPRIMSLLRDVAVGPFEDGMGDPLQTDARAAIDWIAASPSRAPAQEALSILATFAHEVLMGAFPWSEHETKARIALERAGLLSLESFMNLAAAPSAPAQDLHAAIMNLPCVQPTLFVFEQSSEQAYLLGHRRARHDAAELVAAAHSADAKEALRALDERLRACSTEPISAAEAYDTFYQEMVAEALASGGASLAQAPTVEAPTGDGAGEAAYRALPAQEGGKP